MPNWCWNHLEVTGDEKQLHKFVEKSTSAHKETEFSFEGTLPRGNIKDWWNWSIENWGTKWDAHDPYIYHNDINYFAVSFQSAWSPPIAWIENIMKDFPGLQFILEYDEPGMCFGGKLLAQHNKLWDDDHWDLDQASECCEGEVNWEHEEFEQQCLICGNECETISINASQVRPAKIKINENKKDR